jgi:hypothetical protein
MVALAIFFACGEKSKTPGGGPNGQMTGASIQGYLALSTDLARVALIFTASIEAAISEMSS